MRSHNTYIQYLYTQACAYGRRKPVVIHLVAISPHQPRGRVSVSTGIPLPMYELAQKYTLALKPHGRLNSRHDANSKSNTPLCFPTTADMDTSQSMTITTLRHNALKSLDIFLGLYFYIRLPLTR